MEQQLIDDARSRGRAAGETWMLSGFQMVDVLLYGAVTALDPPSPLSGEWAGESIPELGLAEAESDELDDWEAAFIAGWAVAIEERAVAFGPRHDLDAAADALDRQAGRR